MNTNKTIFLSAEEMVGLQAIFASMARLSSPRVSLTKSADPEDAGELDFEIIFEKPLSRFNPFKRYFGTRYVVSGHTFWSSRKGQFECEGVWINVRLFGTDYSVSGETAGAIKTLVQSHLMSHVEKGRSKLFASLPVDFRQFRPAL